MLALLLARASETASRASHTALIGLSAGLALLFGLAFLTLAAWLYLAAVASPITAALVIGSIYAGIGLVLVAVLSARSRARRRARAMALAATATAAPLAGLGTAAGLGGLVAAFMGGLAAGAKARS